MATGSVPPTVLVVDDDEGIRTMLQLALASRGYRVEAIADRRQGWVRRPDVVILDNLLGNETAAQFLAEADLDPSVPVILVTAAEDAELLARNPRFWGVIRKPFDLDQLFASLAEAAGMAPAGH